jgi:hypothetical protein
VNILKFLREQAKDYDCSKCGTNHARSDIRLLGKLDTAWIVRVTCSKCATSFKLLVYVDRERATVSPVKEEPPRQRRPALNADDVIDAHDFLDSFQGDAKALFTTRAKVGRTPEAR